MGRGKGKIKDRAIDSLTCGNQAGTFHSGSTQAEGLGRSWGEDQAEEKLLKAKSKQKKVCHQLEPRAYTSSSRTVDSVVNDLWRQVFF